MYSPSRSPLPPPSLPDPSGLDALILYRSPKQLWDSVTALCLGCLSCPSGNCGPSSWPCHHDWFTLCSPNMCDFWGRRAFSDSLTMHTPCFKLCSHTFTSCMSLIKNWKGPLPWEMHWAKCLIISTHHLWVKWLKLWLNANWYLRIISPGGLQAQRAPSFNYFLPAGWEPDRSHFLALKELEFHPLKFRDQTLDGIKISIHNLKI